MIDTKIKLKIRSLRAKIEELQESVEPQIVKLREEIQNILVAASPVAVGDIVANKQGKEFRVVSVGNLTGMEYGSEPWVRGNPRKENGDFGKAERALYGNWRVVWRPDGKKPLVKMYDPPAGWRYGFPKQYDPRPNESLTQTLLRDGYPQKEIDNGGCEHVRFWEQTE